MLRQIFHKTALPLLFLIGAVVLSLVAIERVSGDKERIARLTPKPAPEPQEPEERCVISCYDKMFKEIGNAHNVDWLLLAAIASVESKFNPDATSKAGAAGLMQVMPSVAKSWGYKPEDMFDERTCVELGAKLLHKINDMLSLPNGFNKDERLNFILACYNAGYGRIADARRLARYHGDSSGQWAVVANYLPLLAEPEYANHEAVKSGAFYGSAETIGYVKKVVRVYRDYKQKVAKAATTNDTP